MPRLKTLIAQIHERSLWQILVGYMAGAWIVLGAADTLTSTLGLPDWVPPIALVICAMGLPLVLVTGIVQKGGPLRRQRDGEGEGKVDVSGARLWLTWRNAVAAVLVALGLLGAGTTGYMGMRLTGVGPAGTLISSGVLERRDPIVLADFVNHTDDSTNAIAVTEALRVDLSASTVIRLADRNYVAQALSRMGRDRNIPLDYDVAREIAIREGMKAVLHGEISSVGPGYILSAWLSPVDTGEVMLAYRVSAGDSTELIAAIDRLSKRIRKQVGESLKTIRQSEPLAQVTTQSLEALRLYSRGMRSDNVWTKIELLEQAIALDSSFAMAYRGAGARLRFLNEYDRATAYITKAYELRERLTQRERWHVEAMYQWWVVGGLDETIAAYTRLLEYYPDDMTALQNLTVQYFHLRDWAMIKELNAHRLEVNPNNGFAWPQLFSVAMNEGRLDDAERISQEWDERVPGSRYRLGEVASLKVNLGDYEAAEALARRAAEIHDDTPASRRRGRLVADALLAELAMVQGRLDESSRHLLNIMKVHDEHPAPRSYLVTAIKLALIDAWYRADTADAIRTLNAALERYPFDSIPPLDRPYIQLIRFYAYTGRADRARALVDEYEALVPPPMQPLYGYTHHRLLGEVALAEGRLDEAIEELGTRDIYRCAVCGQPPLGRAYELIGQPDSAIAAYGRFADTPQNFKILGANGANGLNGTYWLPIVYERLGELYEQRGESERAVHYYGMLVDLWKNADADLQPRVDAARRAMVDLTPDT